MHNILIYAHIIQSILHRVGIHIICIAYIVCAALLINIIFYMYIL